MVRNNNPVIIIGMARSGTTAVLNLLGAHKNVCVVNEPHVLWKLGSFNYLNDQHYNINKKKSADIRKIFMNHAKSSILVEKSPTNIFRSNLVFSVFPDAKIVYLERNPIRLIYSNYQRSLNTDSFKLSIILKKYLKETGTKELPNSISSFSLFKQIQLNEIPQFFIYIIRMFYIRNVKRSLPFGPKLKQFAKIVKEKGLLFYHVEVFKQAQIEKEKFKKLYLNNMMTFQFEDLMTDTSELKKLFDFSGLTLSETEMNDVIKNINNQKVLKASLPNPIDSEILKLLRK